MSRINLLPKWVFPDSRFSVYDTESGTAIEMVSKVYNAMRTLQTDYNKFIDEINVEIKNFMSSTTQTQSCFLTNINKIVHDYIAMLDEKIKLQDSKVAEAVKYMKENIKVTTHEVILDMKENGELTEVIMNVFNEILEKITEIETNIATLKSELETKITESENRTNETLTGHNNRIKNLEDTKPTLIYNTSEKGITITNLGGVENE